MKYTKVIKGKFIARPNRFVAEAEIDGQKCTAHVKNTGRCRELLLPGASIWLEDFRNRMGNRKLNYSLVAVEKNCSNEEVLINMDSQAPNKVVREALESGTIRFEGMSSLIYIKAEKTYKNSRFDFYVEDDSGNRAFIEVKGVTLETGGTARFPDAPTERGVKHVRELITAIYNGYKSYIIFVIQMKGPKLFEPNDETHRGFGNALRDADREGVQILAYDCKVTPDSLKIDKPVAVHL